ncbi:Phage integrase family protein [Lacipirellula limnantheis]|uniref:Phage integrase family protein n=2 Tax=Lacipirellula limnantheis TaxID=2528024 RepID=A0A517TZV7_9BACT|nr:Phage integrase family protein [Lacipirellula limnantheis]
MIRANSINTAVSYLAHLRAALNAAVEWGMLPRLPKIPKIKRGKGVKLMRGRAVTPVEFRAMLEATPAVVSEASAATWQFLLRGLWLSGLRLQEACLLHWDGYRGHTIDMDGKRPMFIIRGELEKGRQDRRLPMAPEFVALLATVPLEARSGPVFRPQAKRRGGPTPSLHRIGEVIAKIGEQAKVVVDADPRTGEPTKFASAHDLRRAFGYRWAPRVMPAILQKLMRHASIQTTMQYYVNIEADDVANALWAATSNTFSNSCDFEAAIEEATDS